MTRPALLAAFDEWTTVLMNGEFVVQTAFNVSTGGGPGAVPYRVVMTLTGPDAQAASDNLYAAMHRHADIGNSKAAILTCLCVTRNWDEKAAVMEFTGDASWRAA